MDLMGVGERSRCWGKWSCFPKVVQRVRGRVKNRIQLLYLPVYCAVLPHFQWESFTWWVCALSLRESTFLNFLVLIFGKIISFELLSGLSLSLQMFFCFLFECSTVKTDQALQSFKDLSCTPQNNSVTPGVAVRFHSDGGWGKLCCCAFWKHL